MKSLFHLAYHVHDLNVARDFYCKLLGCEEGRSTDTWVDIDFFGHQLSPHLGVILQMDDWRKLADALSGSDKVKFVIPPSIRFAGEAGEQATMFFSDPSGNPIEVKGFADLAQVYDK